MDEPPPIEWHRVDRAHRVRGVLITAGLLVTFGSTGIGAAFMSRFSESTGHTIALLSSCALLAGLVLGAGSAIVFVQEDMYLSVRKDGIVLHWSRDREEVVAWDDIEDITPDPEGASIAIRTKGGDTHEWHVRTGAVELARRLADSRKKAAHGYL